MKKIYDLKSKRSSPSYHGLGLKQVSKPNYFWDEDNLKIIPKKSKDDSRFKKACAKAFFVVAIILAFFGFILARAYQAKSNVEKLSANAKIHLGNTFSAINNNDINRALEEADLASSDIKKIRLNLQSWGQDSEYFNLLGYKKSKLSSLEILLKSADLTLSTITLTRQQIGSIVKDGVSYSDQNNNAAGQLKIALNRNEMSSFFKQADQNLSKSRNLLDDLNSSFSSIEGFDLKSAGESIEKLRQSINTSGQILVEDFPWLIGQDSFNRDYLILFQNNNELRGSGGFLGSYAIAKFRNGTLSTIDFQTNIYNLDNEFAKNNQISPPQELSYITPNWTLHDSNFALDFPESAAQIKHFYQLETGEKVDGVIAFDTTLFCQLLDLVGPIDLPQYNLVVTGENFTKDVQYEVERGYFEREGGTEENAPKKILSDMMPIFMTRFFKAFSNQNQLLPVIAVLSKGMREKHLVFQFDKAEFEDRINKLNYGGKVYQGDGDFLMVTNTNIGGMKSSLKVSQDIKYQSKIASDGTIDSTLTLSRTHQGNLEWPDGVNNNLARILLPLSSSVNKFEPKTGNFWPMADQNNAAALPYQTKEEANRSEISFWINTSPGETSQALIEYRPTYQVDTTKGEFIYKLYIQKQSGTLSDKFELDLSFPPGFYPLNVENYNKKDNQIILKEDLNQDRVFLIKFIRK